MENIESTYTAFVTEERNPDLDEKTIESLHINESRPLEQVRPATTIPDSYELDDIE